MHLSVRRVVGPVVLTVLAGVAPLVEAGPAAGVHVTAAVDTVFAVAASLPKFPCPTGCGASFSGNGTAGGQFQSTRHDGAYSASFAVPDALVFGYANYTEPDFPLCPTTGSAAGSVNVVGTALGTMTRVGPSPATGTVQALSMQLDFRYVRAGLTAAVTVTGGTATVWYSFPDGSGSFTGQVLGGGPTTFGLEAYQAPLNCLTPNGLWMILYGDVAVTIT